MEGKGSTDNMSKSVVVGIRMGWGPRSLQGHARSMAGEASNAGTRAKQRAILEGSWDREKVWQIEPQAPRGSIAAGRHTRVRPGLASPRALLLNMELGICIFQGSITHRP